MRYQIITTIEVPEQLALWQQQAFTDAIRDAIVDGKDLPGGRLISIATRVATEPESDPNE